MSTQAKQKPRKQYESILVYLSREQKRTIKRQANTYGMSVADFVRIRLGVQKPPPATFMLDPDRSLATLATFDPEAKP